jgi:hypothetical protein
MTAYETLKEFISNNSQKVFFTDDILVAINFSRSSVMRALKLLLQEESLFRLGYGIYVTSAATSFGTLAPSTSVEKAAVAFFRKKNIPWKDGYLRRQNLLGRSTQIPVRSSFDVGNSRITRKIGVGKCVIQYERNCKTPDLPPIDYSDMNNWY